MDRPRLRGLLVRRRTVNDTWASPFVVFLLALAAGALLYAWSRRAAPKPAPLGDKAMPYVGGEPAPAQPLQPGYGFFTVALFFTHVHVAALVHATMPTDVLPWGAIGYLGIVGTAVVVLRWET